MKKNHTIENGIPMISGKPIYSTNIDIDMPICADDGCSDCNFSCPCHWTKDARPDDQIKHDVEMCEQNGCGMCMKRDRKIL